MKHFDRVWNSTEGKAGAVTLDGTVVPIIVGGTPPTADVDAVVLPGSSFTFTTVIQVRTNWIIITRVNTFADVFPSSIKLSFYKVIREYCRIDNNINICSSQRMKFFLHFEKNDKFENFFGYDSIFPIVVGQKKILRKKDMYVGISLSWKFYVMIFLCKIKWKNN